MEGGEGLGELDGGQTALTVYDENLEAFSGYLNLLESNLR